ncbi:MAG: DinB family protein [Gemmatimonadota bacterium]
MDSIGRLMAHLVWADQLVVEALESATAPDPRALELTGHVLGAERVWLARIRGEPASVPVWPSPTLTECRELLAGNCAALQQDLDRLTATELGRPVTYTNSAGVQFTNTVQDILLHVCLHGAYHRGQVAQLLRAQGSSPNPTDYIAFIRGEPTATRTDSDARAR